MYFIYIILCSTFFHTNYNWLREYVYVESFGLIQVLLPAVEVEVEAVVRKREWERKKGFVVVCTLKLNRRGESALYIVSVEIIPLFLHH
jgi:hypothetical protein